MKAMKQKILEITKELTNEELKKIIKEAIEEASTIKKATLTIEECTSYAGIGRDKIIELAHGDPDFPAFRVGKKFLINKELLDAWLKRISEEKKAI
jgi:excisionase family DNA binding protein